MSRIPRGAARGATCTLCPSPSWGWDRGAVPDAETAPGSPKSPHSSSHSDPAMGNAAGASLWVHTQKRGSCWARWALKNTGEDGGLLHKGTSGSCWGPALLARGSSLGQPQRRQNCTTKEPRGFELSTKTLSGSRRKAETPALEELDSSAEDPATEIVIVPWASGSAATGLGEPHSSGFGVC